MWNHFTILDLLIHPDRYAGRKSASLLHFFLDENTSTVYTYTKKSAGSINKQHQQADVPILPSLMVNLDCRAFQYYSLQAPAMGESS